MPFSVKKKKRQQIYIYIYICIYIDMCICPSQYLKESRLGHILLISEFSDFAQICCQKLFPVRKTAKVNRFIDILFSIYFLIPRTETISLRKFIIKSLSKK